ncbi:predicted integral membrane protein [Hahella chejuensis KCTC 2396]|uniref:Predicted integral membrane protein n=1 Tax=Hahella chejuensis (strain KCTC 2396) TaxID=349521 RepID=Q2S703_HAHCH|nr:DUF2269 domain-containing protein [Hahella chejuensis]ABC33571.1 predicted integral membrane protein [Hahella chejuensis KCTC 2396]
MEWYPLVKLIHILSSTLLFGTGLGTAFYMWRADCSGDVRVIAVVARNVVLADWLFTTPAVIIQPLTGFLMLHWLNIPYSTPWIWMSLALFILVGLCWLPVVWLQIQVARGAETALREGTGFNYPHRAYMRIWYALGWPAFFAVIGIFYLMVTKQGW